MRKSALWSGETGRSGFASDRRTLWWGVLGMLAVLVAGILVVTIPVSAKDEKEGLVYFNGSWEISGE